MFWMCYPPLYLSRAGDRLRRSYKHSHMRTESEQMVKIRALRLSPIKTKQTKQSITKQIITYS